MCHSHPIPPGGDGGELFAVDDLIAGARGIEEMHAGAVARMSSMTKHCHQRNDSRASGYQKHRRYASRIPGKVIPDWPTHFKDVPNRDFAHQKRRYLPIIELLDGYLDILLVGCGRYRIAPFGAVAIGCGQP